MAQPLVEKRRFYLFLGGNSTNSRGFNPLYLATQFGHQDVVEFLLDCGADVNALDFKRSSPLFGAAQNHHLQVVKSLLSRGAEVNLTDDEGWTPLLRAFQKSGGDEIIKSLVNHSANVNVRGCGGESPLHIAVAQNNKNIVELLLSNGAREGLE
ncbi:MAG: ankyrin repeat domain-containing protein [Nostoc sp.]|uniref:ankyrin repeat domain-containing protein n=1 Tax=Nostoc sp. TaxID=1180 RepID=UPI002FF81612